MLHLLQRTRRAVSSVVPRAPLQTARPRGVVRHGSSMAWYNQRMAAWDEEKMRQAKAGPSENCDGVEISVRLDRGKKKQQKVIEAHGGITTPFDLNPGVAQGAIGAILNFSTPWGLHDPLPMEDCSVKFLTTADADVDSAAEPEVREAAQDLLWHSAAHILGQALERASFLSREDVEGVESSGVLLCDGPSLVDGSVEGGFFYEMALPQGITVGNGDFPELEELIQDIVEEKQTFEKMVVSREFARNMFAYNPFKLDMLGTIDPNEPVSLYRNGPFIDMCRGPHVTNTSVFKGIQLLKTSASHWKSGDAASNEDVAPLLQRIYGIAFGTNIGMKSWRKRVDEARARDHRKIGKRQELFMFHPTSPGSAFMLPHGTRIYNRLLDMLRSEYKTRGFDEIMTPMLYKSVLWATSGHLENYKDDMYMVSAGMGGEKTVDTVQDDDESMGLKPMNCPGHCLVYKQTQRSYRALPFRVADFGALHRNELSGTLSGLTRLRKFQQDDAHVFCTRSQMKEELYACLDMVRKVYGRFGFDFRMRLSTRPEKYMGDSALWDEAEMALATVLDEVGQSWSYNVGDGAFYGPKIDVVVTDAIGREHQCATIQLDFQLPQRFDLEYQDVDGSMQRPVMIHRAILGSLERMFAILCEHYGGRWPLWLSPRQVAVCPVSDAHIDHSENVLQTLHNHDFYVDLLSKDGWSLPKVIKQAQMAQYNYILVVGDTEVENNTVNVRSRNGEVLGEMSIEETLHLLADSDQ